MDTTDVAKMFDYKYTIILPTYNEVDNIEWMIDNIILSMKGYNWEIIIVDDSSPDGTYRTANKKIKELTYTEKHKIKLLYRGDKYGLGSAYKFAMKEVSGDWVILMDADRSHNPKYIPLMIKEQIANGADIVNASRYSNGGAVLGWSFRRRLISKLANYMATIVLNIHRRDITGSFRLYNTYMLKELLKDIKSNGYAFQMEMIFRAERKKYNIIDFPYIFVDRSYGKSKLGLKEIIGFIWALMFLVFYRFICFRTIIV
jgi:dolichol-phosphate mannosyltransferase